MLSGSDRNPCASADRREAGMWSRSPRLASTGRAGLSATFSDPACRLALVSQPATGSPNRPPRLVEGTAGRCLSVGSAALRKCSRSLCIHGGELTRGTPTRLRPIPNLATSRRRRPFAAHAGAGGYPLRRWRSLIWSFRPFVAAASFMPVATTDPAPIADCPIAGGVAGTGLPPLDVQAGRNP